MLISLEEQCSLKFVYFQICYRFRYTLFCLLFTLKIGVNLRFNINHQCSIINNLCTNAIKEERKINPDISLHLVNESFSS